MPFRTRLSFTRGTPRGLFGSSRFDGDPFIVGEFVAHDLSPQFGSLNHGSPAKRNAPGPSLIRCLRRTSTSPQSLCKTSKMTRTGLSAGGNTCMAKRAERSQARCASEKLALLGAI